MNINTLAPLFLLTLGISGRLAADTFMLKDGSKLEGKVIRMQGDAYVIEYQRSKSIKDIKIVPKADVLKTLTESPDEKAFEAIAKLVPVPDLLTADDYQQRCNTVKAFIAKYPKGTKLADAQAILKKLTDEKALIEAGGRKLRGLVILGPDFRANAYELDARVLEAKIMDAASKAQWLAVLRAFAEMEKNYQLANCYRNTVPVVLKALKAFHTQVSASLNSFDDREAKQLAEIANMPPRDAENSKRELAAQATELEKLYQKEKAADVMWVTPHPAHRQSLEDDASLAETELKRLAATPPATGPAPDGGKLFRTAWKAIHSDADAETVEKAIAEVESASLPEKYLKMLQAEAKAAEKTPDK